MAADGGQTRGFAPLPAPGHMGVDYEVVKAPWPRRSKRTAVIEGTGQSAVPAIELEDGTWYREQSSEMERAIRAGRFGPAA